MSLYHTQPFKKPTNNFERVPQNFEPYVLNGGTVVAIAGEDYALIGADTRISVMFSICTRKQRKLFKLTDKAVLGITGCWADVISFVRLVKTRICMYEQEQHKTISTTALAQMISTALYFKRFFPYYVLPILAGLDCEGKGCVFNYDPIGHFERTTHYAVPGNLLQPLLDNQLNRRNCAKDQSNKMTKATHLALIRDLFTGAAERDIYTGDSITIMTITADGITEEDFDLRRD